MASKLRKRQSTKGNKLIKFDKFELKDVICSICQSILVEPVRLPCEHFFCQRCFNGSVENNALCCPLCRLRIGSWLRTATKQNNLVNNELWNYIQKKFPTEIDTKLKGGDVYIDDAEKPIPRLSAPGEIRFEYERELERLKEERLQLEKKHIQETELLIKKIQLEEAEAQKQYLEMLKKDEMLAKQILRQDTNTSSTKKRPLRGNTIANAKTRLKPTRIDWYLAKTQAPVNLSTPILTDDNSSTSESTTSAPNNNAPSPEMVPNYGKKSNIIQNKCVNSLNNGEQSLKKNAENPSLTNGTEKNNAGPKLNGEVLHCNDIVPRSKEADVKQSAPTIKSLPVSIPLPYSRVPKNKPLSLDRNKFIPLGIIQRQNDLNYKNKLMFMNAQKEQSQEKEMPKMVIEETKHNVSPYVRSVDKKSAQKKVDAPEKFLGTGSVDSMHQELCYFKPIEKSSSMSFAQCNTNLPVRVPTHRASGEPCSQPPCNDLPAPSRAQYIEGLCRLRQLSLANKLSSAFVLALDILKVKERAIEKCDNKGSKRRAAPNEQLIPMKRNAVNKNIKTVTKNQGEPTPSRRRTRSMGSLAKDEQTPKKMKNDDRIAISERKTYLRSDSKNVNPRKKSYYPNCKNDKVNLAAKNLTDPLNNCDVKTLLEQIRIQKAIELEKQDIDLARQIDAEMNGRRQMRRPAPVKRQVTLNHTLRPAKKLKV